jgi:hypothetical protein
MELARQGMDQPCRLVSIPVGKSTDTCLGMDCRDSWAMGLNHDSDAQHRTTQSGSGNAEGYVVSEAPPQAEIGREPSRVVRPHDGTPKKHALMNGDSVTWVGNVK